GDADELAARVLRLDLAGLALGVGDRLVLTLPRVDERHTAVGTEALVERVLPGAPRASERLAIGHRAPTRPPRRRRCGTPARRASRGRQRTRSRTGGRATRARG